MTALSLLRLLPDNGRIEQGSALLRGDNLFALREYEMQRVRGWGDMFPHVRNFHERIYREIHSAEAPS